ncbi:MAG: hydantoinase/oxoprolinase family protein [Sediminimonas qiaohouensis]|uniref:Hydantoinase/oxoprolinase family protein n=1 Tax=Sediminimonas qiaohouensis TaxID=552061 RepID=A0A7C9L9R5_9RHOB|nr:hydantoinase/oxoprolinase family protein [Sediminimonas qiaohouensis]MTJ06114.1 hydantoinase/oxoprolinase family protein [Sediminimonas qiaohouensis]
MTNTRVAVDVGGTFTDICIMEEETGHIRIEKTASTPDDPMRAIMSGIEQGRIDLSDVSMFSHGTTVATNALITRNLPRAAMVCTDGFRDVVEIRRANKEDLWDTYKDVAKPYIPRRDRLTVRERVNAEGEVLIDLNEDDAYRVAEVLKKRGVAAVAVCFMNSYVNGTNEQRMRDILKAVMPDVPVSISSQIMPEIFEHERFSTTMANAVVSPVVVDYVSRLADKLADGGYERELLLLHTGGGVMTTRAVRDFAARLAGSGIAAGAIASRFIGNLCGYPNTIGFDMGGTSTDVSVSYRGEPRITKDWYIEYGFPIRFPSIEVLTIGAGGGSLAWKDEGGSLRNGPQSAGADPGPACYRNGNEVATNTDANMVLGRLGTSLAGGKITLDPALAEDAVRTTVAEPFNMELHEAAEAIVRVANANMANAVRLLSISRGYDPRDFALCAFGGAGALHGAAVARELSIPTVIVPANPGVTSALGCLLVDIQHDFSDSFMRAAKGTHPAELEAAFQRIEDEARAQLTREGVEEKDMMLQRTVEMMYQGQWRSLEVSAPSSITDMDDLIEAFHEEHAREYSYSRRDAPVSLFRAAVKAIGIVPKAEPAKSKVHSYTPDPDRRRRVWFDGEVHDASIYDREKLTAGATFIGPAIVEQFDSTTVVPPAMKAEVDAYMNILIHTKA